MSTDDNAKSELPVRRYKSRGNRRNIGVAMGAGLGAAVGAVTGEIAIWVGIGVAAGLLIGTFMQNRANR